MALYVVEHRLPGMTESDLTLLTAALEASSERLARRGRKVRYLRSTYLPGKGRLLCWYEAASQEIVRTVIESAQAPYVSLDAAIEVVSPQR